MTTDFWNGTGNWTVNPTDWSSHAPPLSSQEAEIQSGVDTLSTTTSVSSVLVVLGAELSLSAAGSLTTTAGFTNLGTLSFSGAASLKADTNFANLAALDINTANGDGGGALTVVGTLDNSSSMVIGNSNLGSSTTVTAAGLANSNAIILWGNETLGTTHQATLDITGAAPATLTGTINLHGDSELEFKSGGITSIAASAGLQIDGQQSRVSIGAGTTNLALSTLTSNAGFFDLEGDWSTGPGGTSVTTTNGLVNSGTLWLDEYNSDGASILTIGGTLTNSGTIVVGNQFLSAATKLSAKALVNDASLTLWGNDTGGTTDQVTLNSAGAAPTTLTGGTLLRGDADLEYGSGGITTIGAGASLEIDGAQARTSIGAGTANSALSGLATNDGVLTLRGNFYAPGGVTLTTTTGLTNAGTLNIDAGNSDGGSTVTIGKALTNSGGITIGNQFLVASTTVNATSFANTNGLVLWGNDTGGTTYQATLDIAGAAPATLTASTLIRGDADLEYGSGGITTIGADAYLEIDGSQSRISIGATTTNSALSGLATNDGVLTLRGNFYAAGGVTLTTTTGLTNAGTLNIDAGNSDGGSTVTIGKGLANTGGINIGNQFLVASTTVNATSFANTNGLVLWGNDTGGTTYQATLDIAGAAPATLTASTLIRGDADLEYGSGGITTIGADAYLEIDGSQSRISIGATTTNSALSGLATNDGVLTLRGNFYAAGGVTLTTTTGLTNAGTLNIDAGNSDGGSTVTIGKGLANTGGINIGNQYLVASTTVKATSLVSTGGLTLWGNDTGGTTYQATLDIAGAAPATLTASTLIRGDADLEYGSGGITTIGADAYLEIDGSQSRISIGATTTNSALSGLATNDGVLTLRGNFYAAGGVTLTTTTGLTNAGTLNIDAGNSDGGSTVTIGKGLANTGGINIGNQYLVASTTVKATSLVSTGGLTLWGNDTGGTTYQATLDIAGAAPATLTAATLIRGDADLEYGSGGITAIGAGASLELDGAQSRISIGAGTTNSALTGLATNDGVLTLRGNFYAAGGVTLTTTTGLTNAGTLNIDAGNGDGGSTVTIGKGLANTGGITIGNQYLVASTTVKATSFTNTNSLVLWGNDSSGAAEQATLDIAGAAPATLTAATLIRGDADLAYGSGGITAIGAGASLELDGAQSRISIGAGTTNSALSGLATNDGALTLRGNFYAAGGVTLTTTTGLTNAGTLNIDAGNSDGGSSLSIKALDNTGTVTIGNQYLSVSSTLNATSLVNGGTLNLRGNATQTAELAVSGSATNAGSMDIGASAELDVTAAAPFTQTAGTTIVAGALVASTIDVEGGLVDFTAALSSGDGTGALNIYGAGAVEFGAADDSSHTVSFKASSGTLDLGAPASFAGTIAGFNGADVIDLLDTSATSASYSGTTTSGVLTLSNSGGTVATLAFTGKYTTASFTLASDGNGGTDILDPPTGAALPPKSPTPMSGASQTLAGATTVRFTQSMASFAANGLGGLANAPIAQVGLDSRCILAPPAHA